MDVEIQPEMERRSFVIFLDIQICQTVYTSHKQYKVVPHYVSRIGMTHNAQNNPKPVIDKTIKIKTKN